MQAIEVKFVLYVRDLRKTQAFYSVLGVQWLEGREVEIGKSGLPLSEEEYPSPQGLPHLWGHWGTVEVLFYLNKDLIAPSIIMDVVTHVNLNEMDSVSIIVTKLKELDLYVPSSGFDEFAGGILLDPDGRQINLCGPNPFRL